MAQMSIESWTFTQVLPVIDELFLMFRRLYFPVSCCLALMTKSAKKEKLLIVIVQLIWISSLC